MVMRLEDHWMPLSDVLELPSVKLAHPRVLTSPDRLPTTKVKWVHVCEQADMTDFVDPDHLVLTSGVGFEPGPGGWERMIDVLAEKRASGIVVELHVSVDELSDDLVARAEAAELTLIVLDLPSRFVDITHAVHRVIAERQTFELERTARVHETFTRLTVTGARSQEIVDAVADLTGAAVILEDLNHRVIAFRADTAIPAFLEQWEETARRPDGRERPNDLTMTVGAGGVSWGRLVLMLPHPPTASDYAVADRAIAAIGFAHSRETGANLLDQDAQLRLMNGVLSPGYAAADVTAGLEAYGLPVAGRSLFACLVTDPKPADRDLVMSALSAVFADAAVEGISGELSPGVRHVLLSVDSGRDSDVVLTSLVESLRRRLSPVAIAISDRVSYVRDLESAFEQAEHALAEARFRPDLRFVRPADLGARGLLWLLRGDPRVQAFVEQRLSAILRLPRADRERMLETLSSYLASGRNVSVAARHLHLSRPALYSRIRRLTALLDADLDHPETALALQVALAAFESGGQSPVID
ncbi:PucR family transcriptional regulator [Agromyces protaetiae]|uniref:PucR family transcriptional regulator n=1 Tax=Agromyces protaetiae TaxID=2509455 RepID=A0A4P6FDB9_9MICO|nr:PucR family transcriptional regulator [Agromyces protaetiae]QAY73726.1 PucR family transcriptional regulator [Agromyces protaetiae]